MNNIALVTMIFVIAAVGLSSKATAGLTTVFGTSTDYQDPFLERPSELMILAQVIVKNSIVVSSLNDIALEFEHVAGFASKGESDHVANSLRTIAAAVDKLKGTVSGQTYRNLSDRLSDMRETEKNSDFEGVALAAAEGYRTAMLAQDPATLPMPMEVYMLNYTALKAMALARTETPDWQRLAGIGDETSNYATEISPNIKQKALRDLVDSIVGGFKLGVAEENVSELRFVIQLQFEEVDLLKDAFAKK